MKNTKTTAKMFTDKIQLFFKLREVRFIFEIGRKKQDDFDVSLFALDISTHQFTRATDALRLDTFMIERRISGIDILWFEDSQNALGVLLGLGRKIRTVRSLYISPECKASADIKKFLKKEGIVYYANGIFLNRDVAPGICGIQRRIIQVKTRRLIDKIKKTRIGKPLLKIKRYIQSIFHSEKLIFNDE